MAQLLCRTCRGVPIAHHRRRRRRGREGLQQDDPQRINVGTVRIVALRGLDLARTPGIEGGGTPGGERPQAFRRHVGQGPSRIFERTVGLVERPVPGQVEVQKHRVAVGRQQDVRWLHIAMDDVAALRMVKGVGQPGRDPGHGLAVGQTVQDLARGRAGLTPEYSAAATASRSLSRSPREPRGRRNRRR